jgi:hypothetical protein
MRVPPFVSRSMVVPQKIDFSTEHGAAQLCTRIMEVWRAAGHDNVLAWPERMVPGAKRSGEPHPVFVVCTNLVNGMPPAKAVSETRKAEPGERSRPSREPRPKGASAQEKAK